MSFEKRQAAIEKREARKAAFARNYAASLPEEDRQPLLGDM